MVVVVVVVEEGDDDDNDDDDDDDHNDDDDDNTKEGVRTPPTGNKVTVKSFDYWVVDFICGPVVPVTAHNVTIHIATTFTAAEKHGR